MATTPTRLMTFAEADRLPDPPDGRYELHHGELVTVPFPKMDHYLIQSRLRDLLHDAAGESGFVGIELGFRALPEYEYRRTDVAYVSRDRWLQVKRNDFFQGAPDLVIEILSPSNTAREMLAKEQLCLENGAREFWVVDADRRQVTVSTSDGRRFTYKSGDKIPLFFGGTLGVDAIFE
jgi:Uma2 family endonuclease